MKLLSTGNPTSGNWSQPHLETGVENVNLSVNIGFAKRSIPFTAPSVSNFDVGFAFFIGDLVYGTDPLNWHIRLVENNIVVVDEILDVRTINADEDGMVIFKWTTPYQYMSGAVDFYEYEIETETSTSGSNRVLQNPSAVGTFACVGFDNRTAVPAEGDKLFIVDPILIDTDMIAGDNTETSFRTSFEHAINISINGSLDFESGNGDKDLTLRGSLIVWGGGSLGNGIEHLATDKNSIIFDMAAVLNGDYGIYTGKVGRINLIGKEVTKHASFVSGEGTAASPLIIDADIALKVDDFLVITATAAVEETEYKYIISGDFAGGYVLSNTMGGGESAFSNVHDTNALVGNLTRTLSITTNDVTKGFFLYENRDLSEPNISEPSHLKYVTFSRHNSCAIDSLIFTGCVNYNAIHTGVCFNFDGKYSSVHEHNIFCDNLNQTAGADYLIQFGGSSANQQFKSSLFVDILVNISNVNGYNNGYLDCDFIDSNLNGGSNGGAFRTSGGTRFYFKGCRFEGMQSQVLRIRSNADIKFTACVFGDYLPAPQTMNFEAEKSCLIVFVNCIIKDVTLGTTLQIGIPGSQVRFHYCELPGVTSNEECITYDTNGMYYKTGKDSAGVDLSDGIVRTEGNHALKLEPAGMLSASFKVLAEVSKGILISGWFRTENFAPGDLFRADLYLPGSVVPDDSVEFTEFTNGEWANSHISSYFTGVIPGFAEVVISTMSTQADAKIYFTDILDGDNDITGLNIWDDAVLSPVMFNTGLAPAQIWNHLIAPPIVEGSYGESMLKLQYGGEIHIDPINGVDGTSGVLIGSESNPSKNLPDALTIAGNMNISRLRLVGDVTADDAESLDGFTITSNRSKGNSITLVDPSTELTYFDNLTVAGVVNGEVRFTYCVLDNISMFSGGIKNSLLLNSLALTGPDAIYLTDVDTLAGGATIDVGTTPVTLIKCFGVFTFTNKTGADTSYIGLRAGKVIIADTCTAGTIFVTGMGEIEDNSGVGCTVVYDALVSPVNTAGAVMDEVVSDHTTEGSFGLLAQKLMGMSQENYKLYDIVHTSGLMTAGKIKIYPTAADLEGNRDELATYQIESAYDVNGLLSDYSVVKI